MLILAAVLVPPMVSVPVAAGLGGLLIWYWTRLARPEVPPGRRRIRRPTVAIMLVLLPVIVHAASYLDPAVHPQRFLNIWLLVMLAMLLIAGAALADVVQSLRLHREQKEQLMTQATSELIKAARAAQASDRPAISSTDESA